MPQEELNWVEAFAEVPVAVILLVAGVVWGLIELRVRKLIDAREEAIKEEVRREMTRPIAEIGMDAMKCLDLANDHQKRIIELETKTAVFWGMIERSTANLLRRPGDDS